MKERRLLHFEQPRNFDSKPDTPPAISGSLRSLQKTTYDRLVETTKETGFDLPYNTRFAYEDENGATKTFGKVPGYIVQKEVPGILIQVDRSIRFVPDATFTGQVWTVENGKKKRLLVDNQPTELDSDQMLNDFSLVPPRGINADSDESNFPSFSSEENIPRQTNESPMVSDENTAPKEEPKTETREPVTEVPSYTEIDDTMRRAAKYLDSYDTYFAMGADTRNFLKMYNAFGRAVDTNRSLANRFASSVAFRSFESAVANGQHNINTSHMDTLATQLTADLAEKLLGAEDDKAEKNAYIHMHNQLRRQFPTMRLDHLANRIYDQRYLQNPRGRYPEKEGRLPAYRSHRTRVVEGYRIAMEDAYIALAVASEADAPRKAREFRAYQNAHRTLRSHLLREYEDAWRAPITIVERGQRRQGKVSDYSSDISYPRDAAYTDRVDAFWKRHRFTDALMTQDFNVNDRLSRSQRERAEERLRTHAPDYPSLIR